jgi:hypothetical protein
LGKLANKYNDVVFACCIYIFYHKLDDDFTDWVRKSIPKLHDDIPDKVLENTEDMHPTTPAGDVLDSKFWQMTLPAVNRCGDEMLKMMENHPQTAFGANIVIFYESLSPALLKTVERLRYLNTRYLRNVRRHDKTPDTRFTNLLK